MIDAWPDKTWVPDSCCLPADFVQDCGKSGDSQIFYSTGCSEQIHTWFMQRLHIVGVVGLIVAFIQVCFFFLNYFIYVNSIFLAFWTYFIHVDVLYCQI